MKILLVNDDGIFSEGINILAKSLEKDHELLIVAPEEQRSAQSQAITVFESITVKQIELKGIRSDAYSISGTPVDCVRVALDKLIEKPIDLVISGINMGLNAGMDILYSGTVAATIEANLYDLPAIAISAEYRSGKINYQLAADCGKYVLEKAGIDLLNNNIILNINAPYTEDGGIKGIKACRVGDIIYDYYDIMENEGDGQRLLRIRGRKEIEFKGDTDRFYLSKGYATITPLHYDLTSYNILDKVKGWL